MTRWLHYDDDDDVQQFFHCLSDCCQNVNCPAVSSRPFKVFITLFVGKVLSLVITDWYFRSQCIIQQRIPTTVSAKITNIEHVHLETKKLGAVLKIFHIKIFHFLAHSYVV